jgi:hypothetical protein
MVIKGMKIALGFMLFGLLVPMTMCGACEVAYQVTKPASVAQTQPAHHTRHR